MELDNSSNLVTESTTTNTVAAPTVEAPAPVAPVSEAPAKLSPDELYAAHLAEQKGKAGSQPAETTTPATSPEKAPVSATVAAPDTAASSTVTTPTEPALTVEEQLAKAQEKLQQIEQARQAAEVRTLTERQQSELASDKALLDRTGVALDRKINQCNGILQEIAQARAEGDLEQVEELNARYAEAYDEAQILETNKARFDREYQSKANYFQSQYAKSREGENQKVLDQIFKPFGLETKAVLEKVPEQYRNNPFAVMDYALKQIASTKDTEIASLKEQLKTADEKANEKYRAKWDNSNPASVPHKSSGGGNSGEVKFSKDVPSDYWYDQYQKEKAAR
jgi:hypothetical protein